MNKEIKEILNYMKQYVENIYEHDSEPMLNWKDLQIVLSYIEQLKKRNKELYEGFMATQEELTDYATKNEQLEEDYKEANESVTWWTNRFYAVERDKKQLENNRDKAIEYIEKYLQISILPNNQIINGTEVVKRINKIEDILKGDSDNE